MRSRDKYIFTFLSNAGELKERVVKFPKMAGMTTGASNELYVQLVHLTNASERTQTGVFNFGGHSYDFDPYSELLVSVTKEALFGRDPEPKVYFLSNGVLRLEKKPWRPKLKMRTFRRRFDELKLLEAGWLNGEGVVVPAAGLDRLAALFDKYYPDDIALPLVFPTLAGGVEVEWNLSTRSISLEVDLGDMSADLNCYNTATGEQFDKFYDLDSPEDWALLADLLRIQCQ